MRGKGKREKKIEKEAEGREDNRCEEGSWRVGNLGQGGRSNKVKRGGKKIGTKTILQVDQSFWKESEWKDADKEDVRSYNRIERRVCTKKREDVSVIERREGRGVQVYKWTIEKGLY